MSVGSPCRSYSPAGSRASRQSAWLPARNGNIGKGSEKKRRRAQGSGRKGVRLWLWENLWLWEAGEGEAQRCIGVSSLLYTIKSRSRLPLHVFYYYSVWGEQLARRVHYVGLAQLRPVLLGLHKGRRAANKTLTWIQFCIQFGVLLAALLP